jgi:3-hydroxyisobutyrate dehydrogenase-like beta-hydroxyacid dehydrogenase
MSPTNSSIALIGFGEVGGIFARELRGKGFGGIRAFDLKFAQAMPAAGDALPCASAAEAVDGADLVFSAVTAAETLNAARSACPAIGAGAFFVDLNSASPGVKREAGQAIDAAGGRYVEAAVMSSVPPHGLRVPMLLGGPHAGDFLSFAAPLGLDARVYDTALGRASAVKLCRSVLTKGIEALLTESLMAARRYGVEADVLASLGDMLPLPDWTKTANYMVSRSVQHGRRRAEEMREAARTVAEAGIEPLLSERIAERQGLTHALGIAAPAAADKGAALLDRLDALLAVQPDIDDEANPAHNRRP